MDRYFIWSLSLFLYSKLWFLSFVLPVHKFQSPSGLYFVVAFKNIIQNSTETFSFSVNITFFLQNILGSIDVQGSILACYQRHNRVDDTHSDNYKLQYQVVYEY